MAVALEWQQSERGYEAPLLDINYGLGDRIQLKFEIPWVILDANGEAAKSGLGNSLVGIKYRFLDENGRLPAMSVYPQVEFNNPTSSDERGLVDRGTQVLLPVELAKTFGPLVSVLELGYNIVEKGSDEWVYGLAFSYNASKRLELLGEIHGIDDEPVFNLGTRYALGKHFTLLASAGRGFREEPKLLGYLGLRLNF